MNRNLKKATKIFSVFLCAVLFFTTASAVFAQDTNSKYTEINVSADSIHSQGQSAIQDALNSARDNASASNPYKIIVEAGTYTLTTSLYIYSNTCLYMDGVHFIRDENAGHNMIRTGPWIADEELNTLGETGYDGYVNITIDGGKNGGVFDADYTFTNTVIKAAHASDFTMKNITVMNVRNAHLIEVAGINGMNLIDCTFKNQELDAEDFAKAAKYEGIQLDILESTNHMTGYRSEDLPMKNVYVDGCKFSNMPRGIGSHTSVYNSPHDRLTITNCIFDDMKSCAVQTLDWKNVEISNNIITNSPRGIAIVSLDGSGSIAASKLAKAGNTVNHTNNDNYKEPTDDKNIVIKGNKIISGTVNDTYSSAYTKNAISVTGNNLKGKGVPDGNYYINGVTIENNDIETTRYGISVRNTRNVHVDGNTVKYNAVLDSESSKTAYNIFAYDSCKNVSVSGNILKTAKTAGVYIQSSQAGDITGNTISDSGTDGIFLTGGASAGKIDSNTISGGNAGVHLTGSSALSISSNAISDCNYGIQVYSSSKAGSISKNKITNYRSRDISVDSGSIALAPVKPAVSNAGAGVSLKWSKVSGANGYDIYRKTGNSAYKKIGYVKGADALSYTDKTVTSGTDYTYAVSAYNGSLKGESVGVSIKYLAAPSASVSNANGSVSLKWKKITGANGYDIYRKTGSGAYKKIGYVKGASSVSYTDKTAASGTSYTYAVRAYNGKTQSAYTGKAIKYLASPNVSVSTASNGVSLKWKKITGANGYDIYRKTGSGAYKKIGYVKGASSVSYTDKSAKNGTSYTYAVRAYNGKTQSSYSGKSTVYVSPVKITSASNVAGRKISVKWSKNNSSSGYQIRYQTGSAVKTVTVSNKSTLSKTITGLSKGKTYKVSIRSFKKVSGKTYYSVWSANKSIKIKK